MCRHKASQNRWYEKMKNVFILGSINFDLTVRTERMPQKGETACGHDFIANSGGKGANQAVAVSKLGGSAKLIGAVGNDFFGKECIDSLDRYGVDTSFVSVTDGSTGTAVIVVENGDNRIIIDHGANFCIDREKTLRLIRDKVKPGDVFVTQLEIDTVLAQEGLATAKECGAITVLNPAPAVNVTDRMLSCADYVIPNETEAQIMCGILPHSLSDLQKVDAILQSRGAKKVIVTLGSGGCYACGQIFPIPNRVTAVDTTAAGDTFVGALCTRLADGVDVQDAIDFCQRASALTVTRLGAQVAIPYLEELH